MSETRFTPGPWTLRGLSDQIRIERRNAVGYLNVVRLGACKPGPHEPEMAEVFHNAHLIASAPDLYAALEDLRIRFVGLFESYVRKTYTKGNSNGDGDLKLALTDTDRALAKARGEG